MNTPYRNMRRPLGMLVLALASAAACSGDPAPAGGTSSTQDAGSDGGTREGVGDGSSDGSADDAVMTDGGGTGDGSVDSSVTTDGGTEAGAGDSGDTGGADTGGMDTGGGTDAATMDAPGIDVAAMDAATLDAATLDAATLDATTMDATTMDAATMDAATMDAPGIDAPAMDAPAMDAPGIDAPLADLAPDLPPCTTPTTRCGASCVDLTTDRGHCGRCGNVCTVDQACVAGTCTTCPAGFFVCGGACVDIRVNSSHCGGCDRACAAGISCSGGTCATCAAGQTACAGLCVDPRSDRNHCGACGRRCPVGENCTAGLCCGDTSCSGCPDGCLIDGRCVASRTRDPANDCQECRPSSNFTGWTSRADAEACAASGRSGVCVGSFGARTCCASCVSGGACLPGNTPAACGTGGAACSACECPTDTCESGACAPQGPWAEVATMARYTFARKADRTLWAWGGNGDGQLGLGDTVTRRTPTRVGAESDWLALAGGNNVADRGHFCAIRADRSLWCWGWNGSGCLGVGDTMGRSVPTRVGATNDWAQVSVGDLHTCARKLDGTLWCWGNSSQGELGTGGGSTNVPVRVGTSTEWAWVGAGAASTCGVMTDGSLWCWGRANEGQLPFDSRGESVPRRVGTETTWSRVWVSRGGLALKTDGTLWTWGFYCCTATGMPPQEVAGSARDWATGNIGLSGSCAIKRDGTLWCWSGRDGVPARAGTSSDFAQVSTATQTCARLATGALYCWGPNGDSELGLGDTAARRDPTRLCP